MNIKKVLSMLMATTLVATMVGCGNTDNSESSESQTDTTAKAETPEKKTGTIRLVNGKVEIDEQLKALAAKYEEETGVKVEIESIGGGADMGSTLKAYRAAGNMPEMFYFSGAGQYNTWKDDLADLSDEEWVKDTDSAYVAPDGKICGFPYAIEGYGLTYNKQLLEKAGIDPATLVNYNAYEKAFEKIDSMKEELGIDAVLAMGASVSGGMTWTTGSHNFGAYLSVGQDRSDKTLINMLNEGKVDKDRLNQYAKFVGLLYKYSDEYVLKSGTYDEQMALYEDQKTVFIHQGNWIDPKLEADNVEFDSGIAPMAFLDEDTDGIIADAPAWWGVYKDSENIDLAKDFLNYLASSEEGQTALVKDCGMISPFNSCKIEPDAPLAKEVMNWVKAGKIYSWDWKNMPDGFGMNTLGPVFESFAIGDVDAQGFSDLIESTIKDSIE